MELSGGEILVQCLKDEGVEFLFGYPGGAVLHIYDALYKQEEVKHILVRHEQAATHAAQEEAQTQGLTLERLREQGGAVADRAQGAARRGLRSGPERAKAAEELHPYLGQEWWAEWARERDAEGVTLYDPYRGWWRATRSSPTLTVDSAGRRRTVTTSGSTSGDILCGARCGA